MSEQTATAESNLDLPSEAREVLNLDELHELDFLATHPNIHILMHFSRHGKPEDLGDESYFETPLAKSDIYAIENLRHEPDEQSILDDVSKQRFSLKHIIASTDGHTARTLSAIHQSGIHAIITDVGADHGLSDETNTSLLIPLLGMSLAAHDNDPQHPKVETLAEDIADKENTREWIVLSELGKKIEGLSHSDPNIAEKLASGELNVFMTFGANHTGLFHKLRKLGLDSKRTFPQKPYIYDFISTVMRQKMFERSK
jgi:hypothetical protein